MKIFKVPDWWDSIRAILALLLSTSYCWGTVKLRIPAAELSGLKELALLALTFYFVLKKRDEGNQGGGDGKTP